MSGLEKKIDFLKIFILNLTFHVIFAPLAFAQNLVPGQSNDRFAIKGQWFLAYEVGKHHGDDFNQFLLKRGYITIERAFNSTISGRITPDISVDREGDGMGDIELRLKYCYLKYKLPAIAFFTRSFIEFGLVHRPWLDFEQHINCYRVQGHMFLERNHILNSADYGATLVSLLGAEMDDDYKQNVSNAYPGKYGSIAIGIYNGGGYHAIEKNTDKTVEWRFTIRPMVQYFPGLQFSYAGAKGKGNIEQSPDWNFHSAFVSWEHQNFVFTGMYFSGNGNSFGSAVNNVGNSLAQHGYSLFGELKFFSQKLSIIGRYDYFNSEVKPKDIFMERYIAGVAYHFLKGCKILLDYDILETNHLDRKGESIFEFAVEVRY